jgi:hypothetical protein
VATQALAMCLLHPSTRLPNAVETALGRAGVCGNRVAMDLNTCMSRRRWFIRWQTVEFLCGAALTVKTGAPACSTHSAKAARRIPCIEKESPGPQQPALHRPDCPYVTDTKRPSKRARFGGA